MRTQFQALGRLKDREMNRTESAYAQQLELRKRVGEVAWYEFEGMKFRLADKCFYTPDFMVMLSDGSLEAHEIKGYWQDDARVKIKAAAEKFPIRFVALKKTREGWLPEEF